MDESKDINQTLKQQLPSNHRLAWMFINIRLYADAIFFYPNAGCPNLVEVYVCSAARVSLLLKYPRVAHPRQFGVGTNFNYTTLTFSNFIVSYRPTNTFAQKNLGLYLPKTWIMAIFEN